MLRKALRHQLKLIKSSWRELQPDDYDAGTVIRVRMPGARHRVFDDVPSSAFNIEWSMNEVNNKLFSIHEREIVEWSRSCHNLYLIIM